MLSVVTGCGFSDWVRNPFGDDEDPRAPAELMDIASEITINRNWRIDAANNTRRDNALIHLFAALKRRNDEAINTTNPDHSTTLPSDIVRKYDSNSELLCKK